MESLVSTELPSVLRARADRKCKMKTAVLKTVFMNHLGGAEPTAKNILWLNKHIKRLRHNCAGVAQFELHPLQLHVGPRSALK